MFDINNNDNNRENRFRGANIGTKINILTPILKKNQKGLLFL